MNWLGRRSLVQVLSLACAWPCCVVLVFFAPLLPDIIATITAGSGDFAMAVETEAIVKAAVLLVVPPVALPTLWTVARRA